MAASRGPYLEPSSWRGSERNPRKVKHIALHVDESRQRKREASGKIHMRVGPRRRRPQLGGVCSNDIGAVPGIESASEASCASRL